MSALLASECSGDREDTLLVCVSSININTMAYDRGPESAEWMNVWMDELLNKCVPMILHAFPLALGTWIAWFSLRLLLWEMTWESQGSFLSVMVTAWLWSPVRVKDVRGSPYTRKLPWLGAMESCKPGRMKSLSPFGGSRNPDTHKKPGSPGATSLAQGPQLTILLLALCCGSTQFSDLRLLLWPQTIEGKMGSKHKAKFIESPPVLQEMLHLANLRSISK